LIVSTAKPAVGTPVVVNASHSRLPKGDRLHKAVVKFGDGSKAVTLHSLKTRARHAYTRPGTFTLVLTVVDKHGLKSKRSRPISVHAKPVASPPALPLTIPSSATPTSTISSLGLPVTTLAKVSTLLGIPSATLAVLPVGFLCRACQAWSDCRPRETWSPCSRARSAACRSRCRSTPG
jgi:hypothetical protein